MNIIELFEANKNVQNVRWKLSPADKSAVEDGDEAVVWVDVEKFDTAWSKDQNFYVGAQGEGGIKGRYPRFGEWFTKGEAVEMPCVSIDAYGRPAFTNGRHRFAWMRDHGAKSIPVVTPTSDVERFKQAFETSKRATVLEGVRADVSASQATMKAYRVFSDYVNLVSRPDFQVEISDSDDGGNYLGFKSSNAGLDELGFPPMLILFGKKHPRAADAHGAVVNFKHEVEGCTKGVIFSNGRELSFEGVKSFVNSTKFLSIFRHELIHILDGMRTKNKSSDQPDPLAGSNYKDYMNSASEFNARYHDLVSHLHDFISDVQTPEEAKEYADLYGITGDFWKDLQNMSGYDRGTKEFVKWISDDRRKALLKRVYRLYQAVMALLK